MVIKESKAYGLYISYASDIEGLKRDYAKSDLIILEGIRLLEDCDYDGCKIILKMYDQFKQRMVQRVKRDIYDQLGADSWIEWRFEMINTEQTWNEYESLMKVKLENKLN